MFKTAIQLSSGAYFLTKNCFRKFVDFFSNSRLEQILFKSFVAIFRQHRENSNPSVHRNILKKMFSFWSKLFFSCLRTFTVAILNIQRKRFCQFRQYGIQRIQRNDWIKRFSYKELELFYHFRILNEKSPQLLPEKFVTVVEIVLRCPGYNFWWIYSIENCAFLCLFRIFIDSASFLADFCSAGFAKLHSMCQTIFSRKNFWFEKFSFISSTVSGFYRKTFGPMAITVYQPCQKCTFSASETNSGNYFFEKMCKHLTLFGL